MTFFKVMFIFHDIPVICIRGRKTYMVVQAQAGAIARVQTASNGGIRWKMYKMPFLEGIVSLI